MLTAPHAYSSDTLQKAYQWLQNYPEYQKNIKSSDQLVALYLSKKKGLQSFNTQPSSAVCFDKIDLNNRKASKSNLDANQKTELFNYTEDSQAQEKSLFVLDTKTKNKTNKNTKSVDLLLSADKKTLSFIDDTQKTFNLSNRYEALRLLVSIGYEKLHKI